MFPNSRIVDVARYGAAGPRPAGTVTTVSFELDGQKFVALWLVVAADHHERSVPLDEPMVSKSTVSRICEQARERYHVGCEDWLDFGRDLLAADSDRRR